MTDTSITLTNGMYSLISAHDVATTIDRLETIVKDKGMGVLARVDHAASAGKVDMQMPDTQVLLFGNPKLGTQLMQAAPSIAIDLPMKVLASTGSDGTVRVSWTDPQALKARHQVEGCDALFDTMSNALKAMTSAAAGK